VTDFKPVNTEIIINNHYSEEFTNLPELSNAWRRGHGLVPVYCNTSGHKYFKNWKGILCLQNGLYSENLCPLGYNAVPIDK